MNWEDFSDKINQLLKENKLFRIFLNIILIPAFVAVILIDLLREGKDGL
jgi:hypothetical protein